MWWRRTTFYCVYRVLQLKGCKLLFWNFMPCKGCPVTQSKQWSPYCMGNIKFSHLRYTFEDGLRKSCATNRVTIVYNENWNPLKLILCTVRVVQTSEYKFPFCVPFRDIFNSINILTLIINYCTIIFISAHCQPHRGFHNKQRHYWIVHCIRI